MATNIIHEYCCNFLNFCSTSTMMKSIEDRMIALDIISSIQLCSANDLNDIRTL